MYGFSGLSFQPRFEEVLAEHPPALQQARKALVWNGVALAGSLGMLAASVMILVDTIADANAVSQGEMVDDSFNAGPLLVLAGSAALFVGGAVASGSQLRRGIAVYDDRAAQVAVLATDFASLVDAAWKCPPSGEPRAASIGGCALRTPPSATCAAPGRVAGSSSAGMWPIKPRLAVWRESDRGGVKPAGRLRWAGWLTVAFN